MATDMTGVRKLRGANTLSTELARELCKRIRSRRMAPGTFLGTEADLAEEFGVSRTVMREAAGYLRGLGVVNGRQRLGLYVSMGDVGDILSKALAPAAGDEHGGRELAKLRMVIELGSLPFAIERITEPQIERMRTLANEMVKLMRKYSSDPRTIGPELCNRECEFHQIVIDAAGDGFSKQFYSVLDVYFRESYLDGGKCVSEPLMKEMVEHVEIVEAIAKRDLAQATSRLREHLRPLFEKVAVSADKPKKSGKSPNK